MKKCTGKVVIVALILITVGIGLFIGGIFAVGGIGAAKRSLAEHGVFIDRGFHVDINHSKSKSASDREKVSDGKSITFAIEDIDGFDFEIDAAKMEIISSTSTEEISVQADRNCEIYVKNGVLHLETNTDVNGHSIVVEIPHNAVFETARFDVGASEVIVEHAVVKNCEVNVGMGNFEYYGVILNHGDIECGMGNVELSLEGSEEDYNYEIDCGVGNVDIGENSIGGIAAEKTINNHADATIEIECGMGNVTIAF